MEKKKQNCWEYKKCGREPGGEKTSELGVCPAAIELAADGIHGGKNGGRCCWVIAGTLCKGEIQGSFAKKFVQNCQKCDFYILVKREEGKFQLSNVLLNTIELNKQNKKNSL
ncbi:MAG: hypothetical protein V1653_01375 [bacterium]